MMSGDLEDVILKRSLWCLIFPDDQTRYLCLDGWKVEV